VCEVNKPFFYSEILEFENKRLKEENEQLKKQQGQLQRIKEICKNNKFSCRNCPMFANHLKPDEADCIFDLSSPGKWDIEFILEKLEEKN
jgi:hypothetical protein